MQASASLSTVIVCRPLAVKINVLAVSCMDEGWTMLLSDGSVSASGGGPLQTAGRGNLLSHYH